MVDNNIAADLHLLKFIKQAKGQHIQLTYGEADLDGHTACGSIEDGLHNMMQDEEIDKLQFTINRRHFRIRPKRCFRPCLKNFRERWSKGSEKKMRFLCPAYAQDAKNKKLKDNENSNVYWVDQQLTPGWLLTDLTCKREQDEKITQVVQQLQQVWQINRKFLLHNPQLVRILDNYIKRPCDLGACPFVFLRMVDPDDEFISLINLRAIYTTEQLKQAITYLHYDSSIKAFG